MKKPPHLPYLLATGLAVLAALAWWQLRPDGLGEGFASGNGRIEATEVDVATKLAGRIASIEVDEGDFVEPGQVLARMDTQALEAQLAQARAQLRQAENGQNTAASQIRLRESEKLSAEAMVRQRQAELEAARKRHARSATLVQRNAMAQ
ncbi:biotin/lipoyl-binding protein, partial [Pseudomonas sp. GD04158]